MEPRRTLKQNLRIGTQRTLEIVGGLALAKWYPELGPNASLLCATEMTTRKQMDAAADALRALVPADELTKV